MDGGQMIQQLLSGQGLLEARVLWASLVGPHRLAMAQGRSVTLQQGETTEIYKNLGAADAVAFVGVSLPSDGNAPGASVQTLFSGQDNLGVNTSIPVSLSQVMIGGTFFPIGFTQILTPDEQLFAQLNDTALGANATQRVVVKVVIF
jgi:hypothetical protein